ncbi:hypothetical protein EVAR_97083_1 [Eumeta japonica]|uniref:Uncharacterized protein n=1 Tax=Eumeta variegata TaxID=151549 RepID=A0A4C1X6L8_EUMVA|nr:hypothetical protein EVAR_97083_1 [Eumeta japonica]
MKEHVKSLYLNNVTVMMTKIINSHQQALAQCRLKFEGLICSPRTRSPVKVDDLPCATNGRVERHNGVRIRIKHSSPITLFRIEGLGPYAPHAGPVRVEGEAMTTSGAGCLRRSPSHHRPAHRYFCTVQVERGRGASVVTRARASPRGDHARQEKRRLRNRLPASLAGLEPRAARRRPRRPLTVQAIYIYVRRSLCFMKLKMAFPKKAFYDALLDYLRFSELRTEALTQRYLRTSAAGRDVTARHRKEGDAPMTSSSFPPRENRWRRR